MKLQDAIKGFMTFAIIIVNIMWAAWILTAIWRGYDFHEVFNSLLMATLCLLCWLMSRRMERLANTNAMLAEEVQRLEDVKKFVAALHDIVKHREWDNEVADIMKEHFDENEPHDTPKVSVSFTQDVAEEDHDLLYGIAKESAKAIISLVKEKNEDGLIMTADALASEWRKRTKHDYGNHRPGVRIDFRSFADDGIVVVMFDLDTVIEGTASV